MPDIYLTQIYIYKINLYLKIVWRVQNLEKRNCGVSFFVQYTSSCVCHMTMANNRGHVGTVLFITYFQSKPPRGSLPLMDNLVLLTYNCLSQHKRRKWQESKKCLFFLVAWQEALLLAWLTHISLATFLWDISKQHRPRCDAAKRILFA